MRLQKKVKRKKVLIIWLSRSGEAAALLAARQGAKANVSELRKDKKMEKKAAQLRCLGAAVELGSHTEELFKGADLLITSPGVKNEARPILWAKKNSVPIISEIEFASWFCPLPIIAITGTNGKTTVTTLIARILKDSGKRVIVCGNIGNPFSGEFFRFSKADVVVLEVSSFQLQYTRWFCPRVGIILNVTQNHFDHHRSFQEYFQAKAKIFANQRKNDFAVLNFEDLRLRALSKKLKNPVMFFSKEAKVLPKTNKHIYATSYLEDGQIAGEINGRKEKFMAINQLRIKGLHNVENAMAAILAACVENVAKGKIVQTLKRFQGVEHRCENVALIKGIKFINDSKSTTVDATVRALSMSAKPDVILICGGRDKGSDFRVIRGLMKQKVRLLVAIGEAKEKIINAMKDAVPFKVAPDMKDAVKVAFNNARAGETVLLSPMCASFDMFENYEQRGRVFKKIVRELKRKCH